MPVEESRTAARTEPLRSAIVGTGFMAHVHASAIRSAGGSIAGVVGSSPDSAARFASAVGAEPFTDIAQLSELDVHVVHICTPNRLHVEQVDRCLEAVTSAAVVCEKPLATSAVDAEGVASRVRAAGVVSAVPFVYRYHPLVREVRQRIAADRGRGPWLLHGHYLQDWLADRSATNWRVDPSEGGQSRAFGDIGVHWCDLMEFVTGQRIVELSARLGNAFERDGGLGQNGTEDGGVISFVTDRGSLGSLVVSQASAGRKNRLWFSFDGPDNSYAFNQEQPETAWLGTPQQSLILVRDPARQGGDASRPGALPVGHAQGYQNCFNDFVSDVHEAVRTSEHPTGMPTFDDGVRAARLTEAVVASHRSRGSWSAVTAPDTASPAAGRDQKPGGEGRRPSVAEGAA